MDLFDLLKKIVEAFERLQIPYFVTGSVASMAYGEPRLTNDIDIVAAVQEHHIKGLLAVFPSDEFYISEDSIRGAICEHGQFNIIHADSEKHLRDITGILKISGDALDYEYIYKWAQILGLMEIWNTIKQRVTEN